MVLKPQDVVVLLKIQALAGRKWSFANLAGDIGMSPSTIHNSLQTAAAAGLFDSRSKQPVRRNLLEFLVHGLKYCFPPVRGELTRGFPTSYAASPLVSLFPPSSEPPPVWPHPNGPVRGVAFEPLYPSVPEAALSDPRFAELLTLIDAIREGKPRETRAAVDELTKRFQAELV
jgi:hypothetical protein